MRQSELAPSVLERLAGLTRGRERVLALGRALELSPLAVQQVEEITEAEALGARFDAAIWSEPGPETLLQLPRLRALLEPGAPLVVVNVVEPSALRRLRAFVAKERLDPVSVEALCTELLLLGFGAPRVDALVAGTRLVTARVPDPDPLDDFFAQPPLGVSR